MSKKISETSLWFETSKNTLPEEGVEVAGALVFKSICPLLPENQKCSFIPKIPFYFPEVSFCFAELSFCFSELLFYFPESPILFS